MSTLPPSPFLNSAVTPEPPTAGSAVASSDLQPRATAEPFSVSDGVRLSSLPSGESDPSVTLGFAPSGTEGAVSRAAPSDKINEPSMTNGGDQEASAPATPKNPDADALGTDCIHEIFHWVRKLMRGHQGFVLDEPAFLADVEEEPLFLRDGDHLRRWEA
jgi:hypothetical protein